MWWFQLWMGGSLKPGRTSISNFNFNNKFVLQRLILNYFTQTKIRKMLMIERVILTKFWGVHVDELLNFKRHIDELMKKLPMLILANYLHRSLLEPHLSYCYMVQYLSFPYQITHTHTHTSNKRLQILWSNLDAPSDPLFLGYKPLNWKEYNIFHNDCAMYRVVFTFNKRLCELIQYFILLTHIIRENKNTKIWRERF